MSLSRQQRDELWGDDFPYSQVRLIAETRILGEKVSRVFLTVEVDINPLTFKIMNESRVAFADDPEIQQLLHHAEFRGQDSGYVSCAFLEENRDDSCRERAEIRVKECERMIIRMHEFVMKKLEIEPKKDSQLPPVLFTAHMALELYLQEQKTKVSAKVFEVHCYAIEMFEHHNNGYAHLFLEDEENEPWDNNEKLSENFGEFFGPEMLTAELFGHFLSYFLPRKVMLGNDGLGRLCSAILSCYRWCCEKEYIFDENPAETIREMRADFRDSLKE